MADVSPAEQQLIHQYGSDRVQDWLSRITTRTNGGSQLSIRDILTLMGYAYDQGTSHREISTAAKEAFWRAMRELYGRHGLRKSREIGAACGISHTTVNNTIYGRVIPSWDITAKLVTYFGGDPASFRELWDKARGV